MPINSERRYCRGIRWGSALSFLILRSVYRKVVQFVSRRSKLPLRF